MGSHDLAKSQTDAETGVGDSQKTEGTREGWLISPKQ
jgi:hypothetical protein